MTVCVTAQPWTPSLQHPSYGAEETYRRAALWLGGCRTVADWGGSTGFFGTCLPPTVAYTVVDGTAQPGVHVVANLLTYREPSDGILLRHAMEINEDWQRVLVNALAAFRQRLVVITFMPDAEQSHIVKRKSGWPLCSLNPNDVRALMGEFLVRDEAVETTHHERIYYLLRRPCAS